MVHSRRVPVAGTSGGFQVLAEALDVGARRAAADRGHATGPRRPAAPGRPPEPARRRMYRSAQSQARSLSVTALAAVVAPTPNRRGSYELFATAGVSTSSIIGRGVASK